MKELLQFLQENWVILALLILITLSVIRLIISNPKYSLKEIAKNPLLIFKLLATATQDTMDMIDQSNETLEDVLEEINEGADKIEEAKEEIDKTKEKVENTIKRKKKEEDKNK